jgi:uncharacterized protein (TIGR00251 family)
MPPASTSSTDGSRPEPPTAAEATWYRWEGEALILTLRVQPRASVDALDEPVGDALRVRLRAPPVDGKANAKLTAFLAKTFDVPRRQVEIIRGAQSRRKVLRIKSPAKLPAPIQRL